MNVTSSSTTFAHEFSVTFGAAIGALTLMAIIVIVSYLCKRKTASVTLPPGTINSNTNSVPDHHLVGRDRSFSTSSSTDDHDSSITIEMVGLNEATLNTYPKLLYSQAKFERGDYIGSCCSICLVDYKDEDMLRLLPDCDHVFHLNCVDPWLMMHPTCPICRNSPTHTPPNGASPVQATETRRPFFDPWLIRLMR